MLHIDEVAGVQECKIKNERNRHSTNLSLTLETGLTRCNINNSVYFQSQPASGMQVGI